MVDVIRDVFGRQVTENLREKRESGESGRHPIKRRQPRPFHR